MAGGTHVGDRATPERRLSASPRMRPFVLILAALTVCLLTAALMVGNWASSPSPATHESVSADSIVIAAPQSSSTNTPTGSADRTARSRGGAVNAAARYATLLAQVFPLDADRARSVIADAASDDARARLTAAIDANLPPLQEQSTAIEGTTTYRQAVLATRLVSYSADTPTRSGSNQQSPAAAGARARVKVWTLLTVSQTPAADVHNATNAIGSFGTVSLALVWERGAWRIDDSTTVDGPSPLIDGRPSTGAQVDSALNGFTDWRP